MTVAARNLTLGVAQGYVPAEQRSEPDMELRIWLVNDSAAAAGKSLRFEVTAPALKLQERSYGPHPLASDPQRYFEHFYDKIAGPDGNDTLAALCTELTELLPPALHELLWEQRDKGWVLWLRSEEEAWIPWEVLKLGGKNEDGRRVSGPYLCDAFQVTRWPAGIYCESQLPVRRLAAVLGDFPDLEALPEEQQFLERLREKGVTVEILPPSPREILASMENQAFDVWHFASHGEWREYDPTGAEILLNEGESIKLRDILYKAPNFCSNHPLVILNACHLGRGGRGLVSWAGWTAHLVKMEAGAVIGALWPIADRAAVRFIRSFYREFLSGTPLAEAVQWARRETRKEFGDEATWLAFTAHGHPLAICAEPESHPPKAPIPVPSPASGREANSPPSHPEETFAVLSSPARERGTGGEGLLGRRLRWAAAGLAVSLLAFAVLAGVRTDTRIELDLTVDRLAFTAGEEKAAPLTDSPLPLENVTIARFARLEMYPQELAQLDARGGWTPVTEPVERIALVAQGPTSQASIEAPDAMHGPAILTLDRWWIEPGSRVVIRAAKASQTKQGQGIELGLEVAPSGSLMLSVHEPFALNADFVSLRGFGQDSGHRTVPQVFLAGRLRNDRSSLDVFPGSGSLGVTGIVGPSAVAAPLLKRELPIASLDLLTEDVDEEWLSTLVEQGTLSYPDREQEVVLEAGEFLVVEGLRDFWLRRVDLNPKDGSLRISLDGIAGEIRSGPKNQGRDHRLSLYDQWVRGRPVQSFAAWVTGWIALALTLAELWQHLAKRD